MSENRISEVKSGTYTTDQMDDAKKLAQLLVSIPAGEKRSTFGLMVEAMIMGAEMAERNIATTNST